MKDERKIRIELRGKIACTTTFVVHRAVSRDSAPLDRDGKKSVDNAPEAILGAQVLGAGIIN